MHTKHTDKEFLAEAPRTQRLQPLEKLNGKDFSAGGIIGTAPELVSGIRTALRGSQNHVRSASRAKNVGKIIFGGRRSAAAGSMVSVQLLNMSAVGFEPAFQSARFNFMDQSANLLGRENCITERLDVIDAMALEENALGNPFFEFCIAHKADDSVNFVLRNVEQFG